MIASHQYQNLSRQAVHQLTAHARLSARMIAVALLDLNGLNPAEAASARAWFENDDEGGASFNTCCAGIVNVQRYLAHMDTVPTPLSIGTMHLDAGQAQDPESFKKGVRTLAATDDVSPLAGRWRHQAAEQLDVCIDYQCSTIHALSSHHSARALTFDQAREYGIETLGSSSRLSI